MNIARRLPPLLRLARLKQRAQLLHTSATLFGDDSQQKQPVEQEPAKDKLGEKAKKQDDALQIYKIPDENPEVPKKIVFQDFNRPQVPSPIYTIEKAAEFTPSEFRSTHYKYPTLQQAHADYEYMLKSWDNQYTTISKFPDLTDVAIVGGGLVGSAAAYYIKKKVTRIGDVVVVDKEPYSPHNTTAVCNGLISAQSKDRATSRIATLSKEFLRRLRYEIICTPEDWATIKYQPVSHLILWPEKDVDDVMASIDWQIEDNLFTEVKLPHELEARFPFLKASDSELAIGTHGNQDECLVDPIALRNLYRTLGQAYGVNFARAEILDFNMLYAMPNSSIFSNSTSGFVARLPNTGELRHMSFGSCLLCLGHNLPYLEARAEMEPWMRENFQDLHFIQPRIRLQYNFSSLKTPVINFPVITDTDGSKIIRDGYAGCFKYYLNAEDSAALFESNQEVFMDLESEDCFVNLFHRSPMFEEHFNQVIKPKLVKRIPAMEDAKFQVAFSGFESYNNHDGAPVFGPHPYFGNVKLCGGFGSRMTSFGPAIAMNLAELIMFDQPEAFDMTQFYWDRCLKARVVDEFCNLIQ